MSDDTEGKSGQWELLLARLVLCYRTDFDIGNFKIDQTVYLPVDHGEIVQRRYYEALLRIPWLAPEVRYAVTRKLGLSLREEQARIEHARAVTLQFMIDEAKTRMRHNKERPEGGIHEAAVAEIARIQGLSIGALKRRIARANARRRSGSR
jgi:hypothetical protein